MTTAALAAATASALVAVSGLDRLSAGEVARRVVSLDYPRWLRQVRGAGFCSRPVRVSGERVLDGPGGPRVIYGTAGEPDGTLLLRCGNRRASVCPSCSWEYKGDVWHLLHAGTAGGSKGIPQSVAAHPMWFVTLTGPSFGAVHGDTCGRGRAGRSASGGRTGRAQVSCARCRGRACEVRHGVDDPQLGEPVCADCYSYSASVAFNWAAPELWRRYTIAVRRGLAALLGVPESRLRDRVRLSYAKVAEFQRRGVVHFHAIIRLDGGGEGYPPVPGDVPLDQVAELLRTAAADVAVTTMTGTSSTAISRFGGQVDIRTIRHQLEEADVSASADEAGVSDSGELGPVTPGMVAAYIAKYATKAAEDFGLDGSIRSSAAASAANLRPHIARIILTAEQLSTVEGFDGVGRWLHMLGFRGHFTTKSRRFSVTLGALRQERADYRAAQSSIEQPSPVESPEQSASQEREPESTRRVISIDSATRRAVPTSEEIWKTAGGEASTLVIGRWRFLGLGYLTPGDALLAAHARTEHLEAVAMARESAGP